MILKHFLKPKWRHSNPMVRLQAIESLGSADQDIFFEISRNDADPAVRRSACKRLERLAALATQFQLCRRVDPFEIVLPVPGYHFFDTGNFDQVDTSS